MAQQRNTSSDVANDDIARCGDSNGCRTQDAGMAHAEGAKMPLTRLSDSLMSLTREDPSVAKRSWYEKLIRILQRHQLSECQRIEVAAYLDIQVREVDFPEVKPPGRRGLHVWEWVPYSLRLPADLMAQLRDLKKSTRIIGGMAEIIRRVLVFVFTRPALLREALDVAYTGERIGATRSGDSADSGSQHERETAMPKREWDETDEQAAREGEAAASQAKPDKSRHKMQGKRLGKPRKNKIDHKQLRKGRP